MPQNPYTIEFPDTGRENYLQTEAVMRAAIEILESRVGEPWEDDSVRTDLIDRLTEYTIYMQDMEWRDA